MEKFLRLLMYMGLVSYPRISDYWSRKVLYENSAAPKVMSRNRFQLLLRFWHFSDNHKPGQDSRLAKIAPLVTKLNELFQNLKTAEEKFVIHESMVPFRSRLPFRQYLPNKSHKYGIKVFQKVSKEYIYAVKMYSGKGTHISAGLSLVSSVVIELLKQDLDSGRMVYVDNYYTSMELANTLPSRETHSVGTLRKNRKGLPDEICQKLP
jgi:hypothetical protein